MSLIIKINQELCQVATVCKPCLSNRQLQIKPVNYIYHFFRTWEVYVFWVLKWMKYYQTRKYTQGDSGGGGVGWVATSHFGEAKNKKNEKDCEYYVRKNGTHFEQVQFYNAP